MIWDHRLVVEHLYPFSLLRVACPEQKAPRAVGQVAGSTEVGRLSIMGALIPG